MKQLSAKCWFIRDSPARDAEAICEAVARPNMRFVPIKSPEQQPVLSMHIARESLLMPLDGFRKQVDGQPVSFDLLGHCAERYGVSLTAAALRWTEIAEERAVLAASRDDHLLWSKSNQAAFKSGAYFATRKNTIELPQDALAHSNSLLHIGAEMQSTRAQIWFRCEPASMPLTEMTRVAGQYDDSLTLLLMPDAEWQRPQHDDGEPEEDTFDRFIRNGQYPVR